MYVCICENLNANVPKSNLKVSFHECKQSRVACSYLEMLPLENCVSPSSPISPVTNHHEFDGSKKQESVPFNLEGRSLTTRCQQEQTPSKWGENLSLPLLASGGSRSSFASDCIPPTSSSIKKTSQGLLTCVSLKRTLVTGLRPHQDNPVWLDFDTLFPITFEKFLC